MLPPLQAYGANQSSDWEDAYRNSSRALWFDVLAILIFLAVLYVAFLVLWKLDPASTGSSSNRHAHLHFDQPPKRNSELQRCPCQETHQPKNWTSGEKNSIPRTNPLPTLHQFILICPPQLSPPILEAHISSSKFAWATELLFHEKKKSHFIAQ